MTHKIIIGPTKLGHKGQYYRVSYNGSVLIEECRYPEHDACRALLARAITGRLRTHGLGREVFFVGVVPGVILSSHPELDALSPPPHRTHTTRNIPPA
jgi:hypothetical protein